MKASSHRGGFRHENRRGGAQPDHDGGQRARRERGAPLLALCDDGGETQVRGATAGYQGVFTTRDRLEREVEWQVAMFSAGNSTLQSPEALAEKSKGIGEGQGGATRS